MKRLIATVGTVVVLALMMGIAQAVEGAGPRYLDAVTCMVMGSDHAKY